MVFKALWRLCSIFILTFLFLCINSDASFNLSLLEPSEGAYFGVVPPFESFPDFINWEAKQLGAAPALYSNFVTFPLETQDVSNLHEFLKRVVAGEALAMVTLEPWSGLESVSVSSVNKLVLILKEYEARGLRCIIRFAHEMNGAWYPWSQQPIQYVKAFQLMSSLVKAKTSNVAMAWGPIEGGGYPFAFAPYAAQPGTSEFEVLDTNKDGRLSMADDMYSPFYPGDCYVDWVGLSLFNFGDLILKKSKKAEPMFVFKKITGTYNGVEDQTDVPDFYDMFSGPNSIHKKAMMLGETSAAFYEHTATSELSNLDVKQSWFSQLFSTRETNTGVNMHKVFPRLKLIVWFDVRKMEDVAYYNFIDWTISLDPEVRKAFTEFLNMSRVNNKKYWLNLPDVRYMFEKQKGLWVE